MTADTRPRSLSLAEVAEQQANGWADYHPEFFCHECGTRNPVWYGDSADYNTGGLPVGRIVCPQCFIEGYEKATGTVNVWRVARAQFGSEVDALIASEANMRHERDDARAELAELKDALRRGVPITEKRLLPGLTFGTFTEAS